MKKFLCAAAFTFVMCAQALAASYSVTSDADGGAGSLRQAVLDANAGTEDSVINIASTIKRINIGSEIGISSSVRINGNGVTLDGGGSRMFRVTGGLAEFDRITFTGGANASGNGGAVNIEGDNAAGAFTNCTFFANSAAQYGGAVCVSSGSFFNNTNVTTFKHCTVAGCSAYAGGGVAVLKGYASFFGTIITGSSAEDGGDLYCAAGASVAGEYNVIGGMNASASLTADGNNIIGASSSDVFLSSPLELEDADGREVLKLARMSPALDMIPLGTSNTLDVDERGAKRPQLNAFDAGALEVKPVPFTYVGLSGAPYIMTGSSEPFNFSLTPADATVSSAEWSVSDPSVVSVDAVGNVTALRDGVTSLRVTVNGWNADGSRRSMESNSFTIRTGSSKPTYSVIIDAKADEINDRSMRTGDTVTLTPNVRTLLNAEDVDIPYTLRLTNTNGGVISFDVNNEPGNGAKPNFTLYARAEGESGVELTAALDLKDVDSRYTKSFIVEVSGRKKSSNGGGGCSGLHTAFILIVPLMLFRKR